MLKNPLPATVSRPDKRLLIVGMILLSSLFVPAATLARNDDAAQETPAASSLAWAPESLVYLIDFKLDALRKTESFTKLLAAMDEAGVFKNALGIAQADISRVQSLSFMPDDFAGDGRPIALEAILLHASKPLDKEAVLKNLAPRGEAKPIQQGGQQYYQTSSGLYVAFPAANLMVTSRREEALQTVLAAGEEGSAEAKWAADWERVSAGEIVVFARLNALPRVFYQQANNGPPVQLFGMFSPLWRNTRSIGLCVSAEEQFQLRGYATINKPEDAKKVRRNVEALLTVTENTLGQWKLSLEQEAVPASRRNLMQAVISLAEPALAAAEVKEEGNLVTLNTRLDAKASAQLLQALLPAVMEARAAARRSLSKNNLKRIALAIYNYHDEHRHLPPAVAMGPDGKTPHSWRVELLPYLDAKDVYNEYRMNEPWDSEHNKKLLARMPAVFRHPESDPNSFNAGYFVLVGKDTLFGRKDGVRLRDVTDGISNTLMAVSADRAIPWTKPEDIPYDVGQPLPTFGGFFKGGFEAAMADGSVRFIADNIAEKTLRALITINDGMAVGEF